ncbi:hypothetical protein SAMN04487884_109138 [Butyrivibrio fibrisolvens]|uniref:Uncharacterized protein n=1 Tax=Butyrivibrio fibrisolvens TaxID=831 RepID=A0A1H9RFC1_BUTFI|nr:DUF6033 family protein [Butyrivibrio fibrisolvens]SER71245.1 hypothetical protein SAMN04487884_109138 [Butyrivibrio fibrisolvens]
MDIGNIGSVASAYQYANQIRNRQVSSTGFANSLNAATSSDDKVDAYKNSLQNKFGCPITIASVGKDQNSMDRFAGGTVGSGNVAIAPNILEQMANDPEKAAYYEKKIQEHFDSLPSTEAFLGAHNLRMTTSGVTIHEDGTVTYYCSCEETPEYKAKVAADHKAKREKEAKERQESIERSQEAADERRRIQEESYRKRSIESILHEQILNSGSFAFGNTPEQVLTVYEMGISTSFVMTDM